MPIRGQTDLNMTNSKLRQILVISPTHRDRRELEKRISSERLIFDDYSSEDLEKFTYEEGHEEAISEDMGPLIERLITKYRQMPLAGIVSTDDPRFNHRLRACQSFGAMCTQGRSTSLLPA